jgi:hypothetical protein
MPFSNLEQITPIILEIKKMRPKSLIDVGCGLGVYGFLCRIYLELYGDDKNFFKKLKGIIPWDVRIDAIEGFEDYMEFIPRWAYDYIIFESASSALKKIPDKKYDLVLALAILEHFSKEDALIFLRELQRIGKKIIVSVPKEWHEQTVPENELETHRSHWTEKDLSSLGFNRFLPHPFVWIAIRDEVNQKETASEGMYLFSKVPEFHNNLQRFLFKLSPISPNDARLVDFARKLGNDSLYAKDEKSPCEKWALRYRLGNKIVAIAALEVKGKTLFVRYIISPRTYLNQMLQKLDNLAFKKELRSIEIVPGAYQPKLEALGFTSRLHSMSHLHGM